MLWFVLVLVVATLLFVPFEVQLQLTRQQQLVLATRVRWAGLCLAAEADGGTRSKDRRTPRQRGREKRHLYTSMKGSLAQARRVKAILFSAGFLPSLVRLGVRLLRSLRPRDASLSLTVGLGDPAATGRLLAALAPLLAVIAALDGTYLELTPDFIRQRLDLEGCVTLRVVPGVLLAILLSYGLTPPPWRALIAGLRA